MTPLEKVRIGVGCVIIAAYLATVFYGTNHPDYDIPEVLGYLALAFAGFLFAKPLADRARNGKESNGDRRGDS